MDDLALDRLVQKLPKNPHIMGKDRLFNAAVLIPLLKTKQQGYCFLFQKRAAHIRQGGEVSFPGGEFEPDTDISCKEAAIRETEEELGLGRDKIEVLGRLDTFISPRGITVDSFLAVLNIHKIDELSPDPNEVERIFLLPVDWFLNNPPNAYRLKLEIKPSYIDNQGKKIEILPVKELGLPTKYTHTWSGVEHRVLVFQTPEEVVWGITAELVDYLMHKLQGQSNLAE